MDNRRARLITVNGHWLILAEISDKSPAFALMRLVWPHLCVAASARLSRMMAPPNNWSSADTEPYEVPRGLYPGSGGSEVRHLIIGLPASNIAIDRTPH